MPQICDCMRRHMLEDVPEEYEEGSGTANADSDMPNGYDSFPQHSRQGRSSLPSYQRPIADAVRSSYHRPDVYMSPASGPVPNGAGSDAMMTYGNFYSNPENAQHMMYTPLKQR